MAFRWSGKTQYGALAAICLLVSACGEQIPSDASVIDEFRLDRAGFEEAIKVACEEPAITTFELRGQRPPESNPAVLSPVRAQSLQTFMTDHNIGRMYLDCDPPLFASFDVASVGLGVSGQLKRLIYSPSGMSENSGGALVADTDAAVAENSESMLVHRDIGDGWFITNSR
jgi:hypothetical protein